MNEDLSALRDPVAKLPLERASDDRLVARDGIFYPIVNGIPRFVPAENYAADFGEQWNLFPLTQLDSYTGIPISEPRLARCLRGELAELAGKQVLEAGSGAGRFTEILLKHGAHVHSFDYSNAVEANGTNNGSSEHLVLAQADILHMPFAENAYDYVICLGVLQHTPNPAESLRSLWKMVRPGGRLIVDHYRWNLWLALPPPIGDAESLYRRVMLALPRRKRFKAVRAVTNFWFPIFWAFRDWPLVRKLLVRVGPIHFYYGQLPLRDRQMHYEWSLLDTHDGMTDHFKHYTDEKEVRKLLESLGAERIEIEIAGNGVEAYCRKPRA